MNKQPLLPERWPLGLRRAHRVYLALKFFPLGATLALAVVFLFGLERFTPFAALPLWILPFSLIMFIAVPEALVSWRMQARAHRWNRQHRGKVCAECGYLRENTGRGSICTECGYEHTSEDCDRLSKFSGAD